MMSPFMYYVLNRPAIEVYITIELNGLNPHLTRREQLISPVRQFIKSHMDGINEKLIDNYVNYICDRISCIRD